MSNQQAICQSLGIDPTDQNRQILPEHKWGFW